MGCRPSDDSLKEEANAPLLNEDGSKYQLWNQSDTTPIKEGYLFDSKRIKTWMVLTSRYLSSYKEEKDTEREIEKLDLFVFDAIEPLHDIQESNKFLLNYYYSFQISSGSSDRTFSAESKQEMLCWIDTIRQYQSIYVSALKTKSSRTKWRTCVLVNSFLFVFKDATMSQKLDVLDLTYFNLVNVSNLEDAEPTEFKLICAINKDELHVKFTAKSTNEMKLWLQEIGLVQNTCALHRYKQTMKAIEFESDEKEQEIQPVLKTDDAAITESLSLQDEENKDKDLDIFNVTEETCKTMRDCFAIKRMRALMLLYDEHKNSNQIQSLSLTDIIQNTLKSEYDVIRILNDYIHIIQTHDVCLEDLCFNDCDLKTCNAFQRNQSNRMKQYTDNDMEATTETIVMIDIMDQIHCYLFHTFDTGHRLTKKEQSIVENVGGKHHIHKTFNTIRKILVEKKRKYNIYKTEDKYNKFLTVSEGKSHDDEFDDDDDNNKDSNIFSNPLKYLQKNSEVSLLSKYSSLKDELTSNNNICFVSMTQWLHVYNKANKFQKTDYAKALLSKNDDSLIGFGIRQYGDLPIKHLIVIMFYTDFDELLFNIKQTLKGETFADKFHQQSSYYWFSKILHETVELYGKDFEGNTIYNEHTLYHNISSCIRFGSTTITFRQPVSVTTHLIVAQRYGIDSAAGYMLQFDAYSRDIFLHYFCTAWLSSFANENESILVGGLVPLKIINSICYATGREYRVFLSALHQISQCVNGYGPDPQSESNIDTNMLDILLFGDYAELGLPSYFIDIVEVFIQNTTKLSLVKEHINTSEHLSRLLLCADEANQPFVNLKNIQNMLSNIEEIVISPGYKKYIVVSFAYFAMISSLLITCTLSSLKSIKICNVKLKDKDTSIKELLDCIQDKFERITNYRLDLDLESEAIFIRPISSKRSATLPALKQQQSQITVIY